MGGNFLLKLNIDSRPIANKYREGKVKRTLKRELKVPEIAGGKRMKPVFYHEIVVGFACLFLVVPVDCCDSCVCVDV